jgi:hypothetical protein
VDRTPACGFVRGHGAESPFVTQTPSLQRSPAARPTVYRSGSALVFGGIFAALCVAAAVDLVVETGTADLVGAAVLLVVAGVAVVFGPYPAAFAGEDGLRIRNPFRLIVMPWPSVTDVKAGLSFVAFNEKRKYTVYAIPVSLRDMRRADKQRYRDLARKQREVGRAASGRGGGGFGSMMGGGADRSTDGSQQLLLPVQAVLEINARREAYDARLKREEVARAHGFTTSGVRIKKQADVASKADADKADQATDAATAQADTIAAPETETAAPATDVAVTWPVLPLAMIGVPVLLVIIAVLVK